MGYLSRCVIRFLFQAQDARNGSCVHGHINRHTSNLNYNLNDAIDSLATEVAQSLNPTPDTPEISY